MFTISNAGMTTVEPRILDGTRQLSFATHGVINVQPSQTFHILIYNLSAKAMYLPNHMMIAYATTPPTSVMTAFSPRHHQPSNGARENLDHPTLSDERSASCKAEQITDLSEALQAKHANVHNLAGAVQYKPRINQKSQIDKHEHREQEAIAQLNKTGAKKYRYQHNIKIEIKHSLACCCNSS